MASVCVSYRTRWKPNASLGLEEPQRPQEMDARLMGNRFRIRFRTDTGKEAHILLNPTEALYLMDRLTESRVALETAED